LNPTAESGDESVSQETLSTAPKKETTVTHDMGGFQEVIKKSDSKKTDDVAAAFDDLFNN